uniref:SH3 domain-containing protein n=1 Tax=Algoriphagus sp. TaxID=1872435 RepID=UPI0040472BEA
MKKLSFLIFFLLMTSVVFSQSYLGWVTKQVNFRQGPGTDYGVISSLKQGTQIFIVSLEAENEFYNVVDIATDKEGYIHKSFIKIGEIVEKNESGIFTPSGKTSSYNSEIEIFNNTSLTLTLKLNIETYNFSPKQKRTIILSPGIYNYRASAPNVIPNIGTEIMESNMGYSWQFYIEIDRR